MAAALPAEAPILDGGTSGSGPISDGSPAWVLSESLAAGDQRDGLFVVRRHAEERFADVPAGHAAGALISVGGEGVAHCPRRVENVFESSPDVPLHLGMRVRFKGA
jgi:hypothetical protein